MRITKITILRERAVPKTNINDLLLSFGESLGLFSSRDKDKSCYRIFIILIRALKSNIELTSDEIAEQTGLSRGTIIYHLNRLMATGIVTNYRNKYFMNQDTLQELVIEMRKNINSMLDNVEETAKKIDASLNLKKKTNKKQFQEDIDFDFE